MGRFDDFAVVKLVEKNERKILNGKTAKDVREAIEFFRSPCIGGMSQRSKETLRLATERSSRALEAMGLSLSYEFPDDPVLKNKIWKEQVRLCKKYCEKYFNTKNLWPN